MKARSVFQVLLAVVLIVGVPLYYVISQSIAALCAEDIVSRIHVQQPRAFSDLLDADPLYRFEQTGKWCPSMRDIAVPSALFGLGFIGARFIALSLFSPLGRYLIPITKKSTPEIYTAKITRFSHNAFKTLYFIAITSYAYNVLQKEPFFPAEFGGMDILTNAASSTNPSTAGSNFGMSPAAKVFVRNYFTLSCGFQLASVYFLLTEPFFADFWESMVQVALAVELILFGYLGNFFAAGAILLLVHDACDILTSLCKALVDTSCKVTTFMTAVLLIASWGYTRLFCVAKLVVFPALSQLPFEGTTALESIFFAVLLLCLYFMNIYWFSLMAKSCAIFVKSGRIMDAHAPRLGHTSSGSPRRKED